MNSPVPVPRPLLLAALLALLISPSVKAEPPRIPGVKILENIPYVDEGHEKQKLDLYIPSKPTGPLLIYVHGGAWRSGTKSNPMGLEMLESGYVVASVEYRFSQDAIFPAQIQDCKAAIRWLRANARKFGYDPERIGAIGGSAGGHLVALLATTGKKRKGLDFEVGENLDRPSAIRCAVDFFGPTDFPDWVPPTKIPLVQRSGPGSCLEQLFGGPLDDKLELARSASPVTWIDGDTAPLFIIHGTNDPLVGLEQSQDFADKVKAAGVEVVLEIVKGGGHGGPGFISDDRRKRMVDFLNRHLVDEEKK